MAFIPTPDVARMSLVYDLRGETVVNTLWFFYGPTGPDLAALQSLAAAGVTWATQHFLPTLDANLDLQQVNVIDQGSATAPSVSTICTTGCTGGVATSTAAPNNVALAVSFRTNARGRTGRGRNYVGGIPNSHIVGNSVSQTVQDNLIDAYNVLINPGIDINWQWGVVSKVENGVDRVQGLFRPIVTVLIVDSTVDSMRTRLPGRGN